MNRAKGKPLYGLLRCSCMLMLMGVYLSVLILPSFAQHAISLSTISGSTYPWEGNVNGLNTGNGNKLFTFPLFGWTAKGGMPVDFTLYQNSQGNHYSELGHHWTFSFDMYCVVDGPTGAVGMHWGNDLHYTFGLNMDGSYNVPTGTTDVFVSNKTGGVITSYDLTTKSQIKYHFTNPNNTSFYCSAISDRNGNTITIHHTAGDMVDTITDPSSRVITLAYNVDGRISTITDPTSRVWTLAYSSNLLSSITSPIPATGVTAPTQTFSYNGNGDLISYTDKRGKTSTFSYNSDDSLAWEKDAYGSETDYDYTVDSMTGIGTTVITDPNGHTTTHTYTSGLLSAVTDHLSKSEAFSYDGSYRVTTLTDKLGHNWTYTFDAAGNVLTQTDPYSHTTTFTYTAMNDVATITSPLGYHTYNTFDGSGNLTKTEFKDGSYTLLSTTNYTRNGDGTLATKVDDNSHTTTYGYNSDGHLTSETTSLSKVTSWTVNGLGVRTSRTDARGRTTTYTLDNWHRVVTKTYPSGTNPTFTYDVNSNLTGWTDGWATWARTFDDDNRLLTESKGGSTELTYVYDATGQLGLLSTMTDAFSRTTTYSYTSRNQLSSVSESSNTASYSYDDAGHETGITNENTSTVTKVYDSAGRLTSITNKNSGGTTLSSFVYAYNNDDQKTSMTELDGSVTSYGYDAMHRLISEARTTTNPYSYSYALDGNPVCQYKMRQLTISAA